MRHPAISSRLLFDQCLQVFADTIAQEFAMPAPEALRQINDELARNAMTRGVRLELRDMWQELQVRPSDSMMRDA